MSTQTDRNRTSTDEKGVWAGFAGVIAILVGILLGVAVGVFFGQRIYLASDGPDKEVAKLKLTLEQKERFATEAEEAAAAASGEEATRLTDRASDLRDDIPAIELRIEELQEQILLRNNKTDSTLDSYDAGYASGNNIAAMAGELVHFLGDLFLQILKCLVIPLVVTSMICGVTSLGDVRKIGRIGGYTLTYYMTTAGIAVLLGIVLVLLIQPGSVADDTFAYVSESVEAKRDNTVLGTLLDVFRGKEGDSGSGMFPSNLFLAASKTNVLALIAFSMVFGATLTTLGEKGRPAIAFFEACNAAIMKIVELVMWLAPIGIFGLVAWNIIKNGGGDAFAEQLQRIGWYVATVLIGLAIHVCFLGGVLALITKRNPLKYTFGLSRALMTAMSTASSSATLPVTMECVEDNNEVSERSSSFVLPLGATINMDGTALYEAVAVIFIAQSMQIDLGVGQLVVIFLTATLAAVGAAGIPEAGLVTMVIVLTAVGLPLEGIGAILAIDWFLDRMRTTVNVYGDAIGAGVVDHLTPDSLPGSSELKTGSASATV